MSQTTKTYPTLLAEVITVCKNYTMHQEHRPELTPLPSEKINAHTKTMHVKMGKHSEKPRACLSSLRRLVTKVLERKSSRHSLNEEERSLRTRDTSKQGSTAGVQLVREEDWKTRWTRRVTWEWVKLSVLIESLHFILWHQDDKGRKF